MLCRPGCVLASKAMLWLPSRLLLGVTVALRPGVWWVFTHICQVNGGGHCGAAGGPSWPGHQTCLTLTLGVPLRQGLAAHSCPQGAIPASPAGSASPGWEAGSGGCSAFLAVFSQKPPGRGSRPACPPQRHLQPRFYSTFPGPLGLLLWDPSSSHCFICDRISQSRGLGFQIPFKEERRNPC